VVARREQIFHLHSMELTSLTSANFAPAIAVGVKMTWSFVTHVSNR
jgi:hypothetical protein